MLRFTAHHAALIAAFLILPGPLGTLARAAEPQRATGLPLEKARICVTGYDHNRPDPFPGLGDFIGWVGDVVRLANGELLFVHSAGYWHVSFATLVSDDNGVRWRQVSRVGPKYIYAPHLVILADDTLALTAGGSGGQSVFLSTDGGQTWSAPVTIDPSVYGYGKLTLLEDESILLPYVQRHSAPQRCYMVRFKVNASRDGVELLPMGESNR